MVDFVYLQEVRVFKLSTLSLGIGGLSYDAISRFDHLVDGLKLYMLLLVNGPSSLMVIVFPSLDMF